jgi:DNA-binding GntR family transcriptional regulator
MTPPEAAQEAVVHRRRASDRVLAELRRRIITLELPPGAVVTEEYLCTVLDCSRTPLREALRILAREHLVVAVPHRGVSIAELSIADFTTMVEATDGVERFLVRLAAERISDEQLAEMQEFVEMSAIAAEAGDLVRVAELDFCFHHLLGVAADNPLMIDAQDTLHGLSMRFVFLGFKRAGTAAGAVEDHRHILAALRTRDPETAEAAVHRHILNGRERMRAAL